MGLLADGDGNEGRLYAHLNYLVFDADYGLVSEGFRRVGYPSGTVPPPPPSQGGTPPPGEPETNASGGGGGSGVDFQRLSVSVDIPAQGRYLYVWVSNTSDWDVDVFFDDLEVLHQQPRQVVEATDYYPFGGVSARYRSLPGYRYGYQGAFAEQDAETGWNSFELRQYDSRIGRWLSVDPYRQYASPYVGMGNDPANGVDPDGGWACDGCPNDGTEGQMAIDDYGAVHYWTGDGWAMNGMTLDQVEVRSPNGYMDYMSARIEANSAAFMSHPVTQAVGLSLPGLGQVMALSNTFHELEALGAQGYAEAHAGDMALIALAQLTRTKRVSQVLGATYKANRVPAGLETGRKIAEKDAISILRRGGDIYSDSRREAKSLLQRAGSRQGQAFSEVSQGSGMYHHFHMKRTENTRRDTRLPFGHSFYGSPTP